MLKVGNLARRYGSFVAVNNVNFQIEKGEIVGLLGHNGAGKTTIMKMLSGYLEPDHGEVLINGENLANSTINVQRELGYLPENLPVYPEMTVADYLDYAAHLKGIGKDVRKSEIGRVIAATDISEKLLEPIYTLSRGYKQRVGVAQALLGKPRLLILDEPTNGLDPTQTEHMRELIREIAEDATVILSTHIMQEVNAICDRVLILNHGELVVDARLDELSKSNRLTITCSLDNNRLNKALVQSEYARLESLTEDATDKFSYRLTLNEDQDLDEFCAKLARSVIIEGGSLYQLDNEKRDLESLFKEVSQGKQEGGVKDAA